MKRILLSLLLATALAGCSSDVHDMTISEFYSLTPDERKEFAKQLGPEEMKLLFTGSSAFVDDTAAFSGKTVGEVIEEGRRRKGTETK